MKAQKTASLGAAPGIYRPMATTSSPTRQVAEAHIFQKAITPAKPPALPKY